MPTKLQRSSAQDTLGTYAKVRQTAQALAQEAAKGQQALDHKGPWPGFQPDTDPDRLGLGAANFIQNLIARPLQGKGEVLTIPDGFSQLDPARLPLGDGSTLPASPTTDGKAVCRLDQILRYTPVNAGANPGEFALEYILTPMAVTAGDGTTDGSGNMYRISSTGVWTIVAPQAGMAAGLKLKATINGRTASPSMADSCVAPFGAVARTSYSGQIHEPCFIYTNDVQPVMVFPSSSVDTQATNHYYEALTSVASLAPFLCKSVETWNGRVYFLNTSEIGIRYSRRLRRGAKYTADPLDTPTGAGFFDFQQFQGQGLRIESLGDVLAAYFSDGVGFVFPTGNANSPDDPRELTSQRGLLSTHGVTSIDRSTHFVIATDGWWLLDASGRWTELGVVTIDNVVIPKWREYFYRNLDIDNRHRLQVFYDQPSNYIYIIYPRVGASPINEVWIYDIDGDRVFIENYPVTCFAGIDPQVSSGTIWNNMSGVWNANTNTWDSYAPVFGSRSRIHGDSTGFVYLHQRGLSTFDAATHPAVATKPAWFWETGLHHQDQLNRLLTLDRITLQYYGTTDPAQVTVSGLTGTATQSAILSLDGDANSLQTKDAWFRLTGQGIGYRLTGTGDVKIHGLTTNVLADPLEVRRT